jgi:hypothetical protein
MIDMTQPTATGKHISEKLVVKTIELKNLNIGVGVGREGEEEEDEGIENAFFKIPIPLSNVLFIYVLTHLCLYLFFCLAVLGLNSGPRAC